MTAVEVNFENSVIIENSLKLYVYVCIFKTKYYMKIQSIRTKINSLLHCVFNGSQQCFFFSFEGSMVYVYCTISGLW